MAAKILYFLVDQLTLGNVLLFVIFLFMFHMVWNLYEFRGMPPGPRYTCLPVIGNMLSFDRGDEIRQKTKSLRTNYGGVCALKIGDYKTVFAMAPEAVKEVLVSKSADYAGRPPFFSWQILSSGGKGLGFADYGPAWKLHRKLFATFLRQYMSNTTLLEKRIGNHVQTFIQFIDEHADKGNYSFCPSTIIEKCVADVLCDLVFKESFNSSHPEFDKYMEFNNKSFEDVELNAIVNMLDFFSLTRFFPFQAYSEVREIEHVRHSIIQRVLNKKIETFDASTPADDLMTAFLKVRAELISSENDQELLPYLTDEYLMSTTSEMLNAGVVTIRSTIEWAVLYLVNNPKSQQEVHDALDKVVGRDRMPSLNDQQALPIIQATIMEIQRLANVADFTIPHYTTRDTTLCGYRVPKDTLVIVDTLSVHLDPKH